MKLLRMHLVVVPLSLCILPSWSNLSGQGVLLPYYRDATCGANCLYAVCLLQGVDVGLKEVFQAVGGDDKGASMFDLLSASRSLRLRPRPLKTRLKTLEKGDSLAITHLTRGHFVLCVGWRRDELVIVDPPRNAYVMTKEEFNKQWSGYVLLFDRCAGKSAR